MTIYKDRPEDEIQKILYQHGAADIEEASSKEVYRAVSYYIREEIGKRMYETGKKSRDRRTLVYMSMEYLPGNLLQKNIDYLGIQEELKVALQRKGWNLRDLLNEDRELGLGYSDMGYLSNGLMDTFASGNYNAIGYGLLYREGYFRQEIVNFQQTEKRDEWWVRGKNWLYKGDTEYNVTTGGRVDISVGEKGLVFSYADTLDQTLRYYDLPYLGYQNGVCNRLRLFDHQSITRKIRPVDFSPDNKRERFRQEYLLVSGALQDVVQTHLSLGREIQNLNDHYLFLMMDTHLLLAIPELMRILLDQYDLEWDDAWEVTSKAFFYSPLIPLEDTLLTLEGRTFREWLPRLWMILEEIHNRYLNQKTEGEIAGEQALKSTGILWDDKIRLYNIPRAGVHEGPPIGHPLAVSHRRWILSGNPQLRDLLKGFLGEDFISKPEDIKRLLDFKEDKNLLNLIHKVKYRNKEELSEEVFKQRGIVVNPHSIFHGYLKDISSSNRQLLMVLWILDIYLELKENPNLDMLPRTVFVGGKAAPDDHEGKQIIRLINRISGVVNGDTAIKDNLKIFFVDDLSLKKEEYIYPALDITHSLTTPTKGGIHLASLTAMINGAVAIASREETNLILKEHAGYENMHIFGITSEEAHDFYNTKKYSAQEHYYLNRGIRRAVDALLGREGLFDTGEFRSIHDMLLKYNDNDFVLRDIVEYKKQIKKMEAEFLDCDRWALKVLHNIALSGEFSADTVVSRYAKIMWQTSK